MVIMETRNVESIFTIVGTAGQREGARRNAKRRTKV